MGTKLSFFGVILIAVVMSGFTLVDNVDDNEIKWYSWEEAMKMQKTSPKKVFIDVYTSWCGYCNKMDRETFTDDDIIKYINENFYAVKFNAEQKENIEFNGTSFKFVKGGRRGYHQLAQVLLDNRMSYPSFVYLDEEGARIMISPGYKTPPMLKKELTFASEEHYKTSKWDSYRKK